MKIKQENVSRVNSVRLSQTDGSGSLCFPAEQLIIEQGHMGAN